LLNNKEDITELKEKVSTLLTLEKKTTIKEKLLVALLGLLLILNLTSFPNKIAEDYIDSSLKAAGIAYLSSRGINASLSVIQDIDFSIGLISGSPGELLDPLNDLIERFSSVMMFAIASLGVQKIMLEISGWSVLQIIIMIILILLLVQIFLKDKFRFITDKNISMVYKSLIFLLALRFSVAFMAITSGAVENAFLTQNLNNELTKLEKVNKSIESVSEKGIQNISEKVNKQDAETSKINDDMLSMNYWKARKDKAINSISSTASSLNPQKSIEAKIEILKKKLTGLVSNITKLISLFIVKSILLPLLFLYIIIFATKGLYHVDLVSFATKRKTS